MRPVFHALGLLLLSNVACAAGEVIDCTAGNREVTLGLDEKRMHGRRLSCIHGDFVQDMTPCAPDGAFGLSAPTGSAALVGVVDRWQDYADHTGGVASHFATVQKVYFAGGFNGNRSGYDERWSFTFMRSSNRGVLKVKGKPDVGFGCKVRGRG